MGRLNRYKTNPIAARYFFYFAVFLFHSTTAVRAQSSASGYTLSLTTHQDKYTSGDTVFLKAYFLDASHKRIEGKHLLNVYLVNHKGLAVQSTQFTVLAGVGYNQLVLPDSIAEGYYNVVGLMNGVEDMNSIYSAIKVISVVKENTLVYDSEQTSLPTSAETPSTMGYGKVIITTTGTDFKRRQLVKARIEVLDANDKPGIAEFSFKVYNKVVSTGDSADALLFVSTPTAQVILNPTEAATINSFQKIGKVYDTRSNQPVGDNTQVLFYLQGSQWHHQTFTLNGGMIKLNLPQFVGKDELFYLAESQREQSIPIRIEWQSTGEPKFHPAPHHQIGSQHDAYATFKKNVQVIDRSYTAFDKINNTIKPSSQIDEFDLVEPDVVVKPDQFVKFESLAEMIREVIPALYHRRHGETDAVRLNLTDPLTSTSNPIYIIDGKATTNTQYFLSIAPSDIESIALVKESKKLLPLRLFGKNGIVILKSKSGKYAPPADDVSTIVEGLNPPALYSKPSINSTNTSPIFRSTLFWQPSLITNKDGNASVDFYTTDDIGEMVIEVEGITFNGQAFFSRHTIMVR